MKSYTTCTPVTLPRPIRMEFGVSAIWDRFQHLTIFEILCQIGCENAVLNVAQYQFVVFRRKMIEDVVTISLWVTD